MSYTLRKIANFGPAYAGALGNCRYALATGGWQAAAEVADPDGTATGAVEATVTFPDGYAGRLTWCPDITATPRRYLFEQVNPGDFENADVKTGTRSAPATAQSIDLAQPLADAKTATVGGALHGSWALAFGKQVLDRVGKALRLFGWNSQATPLVVHGLDDGYAPTTRTPQ
jgi:hypothetical protein